MVTGATYDHALAAEHFTCINLGGVDETGAAVEKNVSVAGGHVNSLWFGVQIPIDAQPGEAFHDEQNPFNIDAAQHAVPDWSSPPLGMTEFCV